MANEIQAETESLRQPRAAAYSAAAVTLLIVTFSLLPLRLKRSLGFDRNLVTHVASHFIAFAALAFVLRFAVRHDHARRAMLIAATVGVVLEILEHSVYGAPLEIDDMALDVAAACIGTLLAMMVRGI